MRITENTTFNQYNKQVTPFPVHSIGIECQGNEKNKKINVKPTEAQRWKGQRELAYRTGNKSLYNCRRYSHSTASFKSDGKVIKASGLQTCSSPNCYYCVKKKIRDLSEDLKLVLQWCSREENTSYFLTTTHNKTLNIGQNDKITRAGYSSMRKTIKSVEQDYDIELVFFATIETTYCKPEHYKLTQAGDYVCDSHSHLHSLISFPPRVDKNTRIKILKRIVKAWNRGVKSEDGYTLDRLQTVEALTENYNKAGLDLKLIDDTTMRYEELAGYLGKLISGSSDYNLSQELSNFQLKRGKGRSFLQLLDDTIILGHEADKRAWVNTVKSFYRKCRVFKNNHYREALKTMKEERDTEAYNHALHYVDVVMGKTDLVKEERETLINNEIRSFIMSSQGLKQDTFVPTANIDIPKDIYNTIGFYNYNAMLFDLIVRAGRGELLTEFNALKAFIENNPYYSNPLHSHKHPATIKLLRLLQDIELKMRAMGSISYEVEPD